MAGRIGKNVKAYNGNNRRHEVRKAIVQSIMDEEKIGFLETQGMPEADPSATADDIKADEAEWLMNKPGNGKTWV